MSPAPAGKQIAPEDRQKYDQVFMQVVMSVQQQAQASQAPQPGNLAAMFHKEQVSEALQGCAMLIAGWNAGVIDAAGVSRTSRALKALGEHEWAGRVEGLVNINEDGTEGTSGTQGTEYGGHGGLSRPESGAVQESVQAPAERIRAALPAYGLDACLFTLLNTLGDVVARVETADGPRSLRVNLPSSRERQEETHRFLAQAHAAGLRVPVPVPDLAGRTVSPLTGGRSAVLASWVEGEPAGRQMSPPLAAEIGRVTARLHAIHAVPDDWRGPGLGADWLRGWWLNEAPRHLGAPDVARCLPAVDRAALWLEAQPEQFQLIHADLHFGNLLALPGGGVGVIDFGECALGHPAFDLAMTEGEFADFPDGPALVTAYRSGYSELTGRPYPLRAREVMTACTATSFLEWLYGSLNPEVRARKLKWVAPLLDRLAAS